jgi:hypothetical protein
MANLPFENIAVLGFRFDRDQIGLKARILGSHRLGNLGA